MKKRNEIVIYQSDEIAKLEVIVKDDSVWLTQDQIAELMGTQRPAITKHLNNIFKSEELLEKSACSILERTAADGKSYRTKFYNLDAIISVGYRVNSLNATKFRQWATNILRGYLIRGHAVDRRFENIEKRLIGVEQQVEIFIKAELPPLEGIFYNGQIYDAYEIVSKIIRSAKISIILIDNYIDESVLTMLTKRKDSVSAKVYTSSISATLKLDLKKHNNQYPPIEIQKYTKAHDRFLIADSSVYHIGASLKDLGKKLFAFSKLGISAETILNNLN